MKLSECTYGRMVETTEKEIGFIVGLTYNVDISMTGDMSRAEKRLRTIPIVKFPSGKRPIHPSNLIPFVD